MASFLDLQRQVYYFGITRFPGIIRWRGYYAIHAVGNGARAPAADFDVRLFVERELAAIAGGEDRFKQRLRRRRDLGNTDPAAVGDVQVERM